MDTDNQEALIRRYCDEAERLILPVTGYADALRVSDELCERFEKECESEMVAGAVRQYLRGIIEARWRKKP